MTYSKEFGARLKEARKKSGLTQETIAKELNLDKSTISKYECGISSPDIEFIKGFAQYLNVRTDWLLFGTTPIFKASHINQEIEELFLKLLAGIRETTTESPSQECELGSLKDSLERLTDENIDNYIQLFDYMVKQPSVRKDIFKFFYIFIKPFIDERLKSQETSN